MKEWLNAQKAKCGAGYRPALHESKKERRRGRLQHTYGCGITKVIATPQTSRLIGFVDRSELEEIAASSEPPLTLGSCILGRPDVAGIVQDALLFFEDQRYNLAAWCIMPNHVHVVVQPRSNLMLDSVLHSWKSFTAHKINRRVGGKGTVWERESFDHLIRCIEHAEYFIRYTEDDPVEAGLCDRPEAWQFSSRGSGFGHKIASFLSPRELPFGQPHSRGELTHLYTDGATYFVTWRLMDAVEIRSKQP